MNRELSPWFTLIFLYKKNNCKKSIPVKFLHKRHARKCLFQAIKQYDALVCSLGMPQSRSSPSRFLDANFIDLIYAEGSRLQMAVSRNRHAEAQSQCGLFRPALRACSEKCICRYSVPDTFGLFAFAREMKPALYAGRGWNQFSLDVARERKSGEELRFVVGSSIFVELGEIYLEALLWSYLRGNWLSL